MNAVTTPMASSILGLHSFVGNANEFLHVEGETTLLHLTTQLTNCESCCSDSYLYEERKMR
jgi:hypothetical protein